MIHDPPVLIMDEPTSGLDPNQLVDVRALIRELGRRKTVLLSTHIMQEVEAICDRVIIVNKGRIVADDSTRRLQQRLVSERVFVIEFDRPVKREVLEALPGVASARPEGGRWRIRAAGDADLRDALFRFAVDGGLTVRKLDMEEHSLEEVFHRLTAG
jgi:ABC-2 type transport system ATP-binding protein